MLARRIFTLFGLAFCFLGLAASARAQDARPSANPPSANPNDPGAPVTAKKDLCSVTGTVVTLAGGEPLRKARVRLENADDRTRSTSVPTDAGGRFEMKAVEPGRYRLQVMRVSYVTQSYGQRKPQDPGAVLTLRPRQDLKDLIFKMVSSGVIAGRILDDDGEPLPNVRVTALREVYEKGKRTMATGADSESNDLGEYRLFGLAPGRYFVSAVYSSWSRMGGDAGSDSQQPSLQGYARMYYPGTADRSKASAIAIKAGEEVPSMEILMRQVAVYHVRGRVYNQITHRPGKDSYLFLMPKGQQQDFGDNIARDEKADGAFDVPEVLPGSYVLGAFWSDQGKNYFTRVPVEVGNADVDGLAVTIGPGTNISGRLLWEGRPSLDKDDVTIELQTTDNTPGLTNGARVKQDGSFMLQDIGDGSFYVVTDGESKDCYLKDAQYAGSSVLEEGFIPVRGAAASLEVTLSSRGGRVQGAVADGDGLPATGVWVALVPDSEARRGKNRLYKSQTTDQYGHFDLRGIAPGDYLLFSWAEVEDGAWEDPEFMKPLLEKNRGEKISVQEGDRKTVNVVAIKAEGTEQLKP